MNVQTNQDFQLIWGARSIAEELNCTERRVFMLLERGDIPAKKVGGKWVARRDELRTFFLKNVA